MPNDWNRLSDLFAAASELNATERDVLLGRECEHNPEMRAEIEELLRYHDSTTDNRLSGPALDNVASQVGEEALPDPLLGTRIGSYEVRRLIGRGGFGNVYLATRVTDYSQKVAIKVLRDGHPQQDTIAARFEMERQIQADLVHGGIARLLDGGCDQQGRPYLVMEYVSGPTILQHCHGLGLNEKLTVFLKVCEAVAHAHSYGVVHRDIKPANILVDSAGNPKLVDFGIAKLTDLRSMRDLSLTREGLLPLTPEYSSPEQVRGDSVGLAGDVYALGVILYEMLTGIRPYTLSSRSPREIERTVCDVSPPLPSAAVIRVPSEQTVGRGDTENGYATVDWDLHRALLGNLDKIVLKALRKEPQRRYRSAAELGDDIRRHQAGLPVAARADSLTYQIESVMRRHRTGIVAAACVLLALTAATVISQLGWRRAEKLAEAHREQLYVSDVQLAFDAYRQGQVDEVDIVLRRHESVGDGESPFEWRILHGLARAVRPRLLEGHVGQVNEIVNVPGTGRIVSVGEDATVRVWDPASRKLEHTIGPLQGPLHSVAVSRQGRYLAAAGLSLHAWALPTRHPLFKPLPFPANIESLAFSATGDELAAGVRYDGVEIVSVPDGKPMATIPGRARYERVAFLAGGDLVCPARYENGNTYLQRWTDHFSELEGEYHATSVRHMAVSRDQRWIAGCSQYSRKITIFDAETFDAVASADNHAGGVGILSFSPDGSLLAAGHADGKVRIFEMLVSNTAGRTTVALEHNPSQVVQADSQSIQALTFVTNTSFVTGGSDGLVRVWPARPTRMFNRAGPDSVSCWYAAMAKESDCMAVLASDSTLWLNEPHSLGKWRESTLGDGCTSLALSRTGDQLVIGRGTGTVDLIDLQTEQIACSFPHGKQHVHDVSISQTGRLLAATGDDSTASLWSTTDRNRIHQVQLGDGGTVTSISPDERHLAIGGKDRNLLIVRISDGKLTRAVDLDADPWSLAWRDDSRALACGQGNGTIALYDLSTDAKRRLLGHQNRVQGLVFSADGRTLLSGGADSSIRVWHVPTGRSMGILHEASESSTVTGLFISPDQGRLVASMRSDRGRGGILIWDAGGLRR